MYVTTFEHPRTTLQTFLMAAQAAAATRTLERLTSTPRGAHRAHQALASRWTNPSSLDLAFGYRLAGELATRCAQQRRAGEAWSVVSERLGQGLAHVPLTMLVHGLDVLRAWLPGVQGPLDQDANDLIGTVIRHRSPEATGLPGLQRRSVERAVRDQDKSEEIEIYRCLQTVCQDKRAIWQQLWRWKVKTAHQAVRTLFDQEAIVTIVNDDPSGPHTGLNNAMGYALTDALALRGAHALADGHPLDHVVGLMRLGFNALADEHRRYGLDSFEASLGAVVQQRPNDRMDAWVGTHWGDSPARLALKKALGLPFPPDHPTTTVARAARDWQRAVHRGVPVR